MYCNAFVAIAILRGRQQNMTQNLSDHMYYSVDTQIMSVALELFSAGMRSYLFSIHRLINYNDYETVNLKILVFNWLEIAVILQVIRVYIVCRNYNHCSHIGLCTDLHGAIPWRTAARAAWDRRSDRRSDAAIEWSPADALHWGYTLRSAALRLSDRDDSSADYWGVRSARLLHRGEHYRLREYVRCASRCRDLAGARPLRPGCQLPKLWQAKRRWEARGVGGAAPSDTDGVPHSVRHRQTRVSRRVTGAAGVVYLLRAPSAEVHNSATWRRRRPTSPGLHRRQLACFSDAPILQASIYNSQLI